MKNLSIFFISCFLSGIGLAALVPEAMDIPRVVGTDVGVRGGIPARTTETVMTGLTEGTDIRAAVMAAFDALPAHQALRIPPGSYLWSGAMFTPTHNSILEARELAGLLTEKRSTSAGAMAIRKHTRNLATWSPTKATR